MAVGRKILLVGAVAAALILLKSSTVSVANTPNTTYVPPQQDPTQSSDPTSVPVTYPSYLDLWNAIKTDFLNGVSLLASASGVTHVKGAFNTQDAQGHVIKTNLLPIQLVSSVYLHQHTGNIWNATTQQTVACAFPLDVFQTHDGYYITALHDTGANYTRGMTVESPWGYALYTPAMVYMDKITSTEHNPWIVEIHPPGSPEYKTNDLNYQCSI